MKAISMTFEADLRKFVEGQIRAARQVRELGGEVKDLTRLTGAAVKKLEEAAAAGERTGEKLRVGLTDGKQAANGFTLALGGVGRQLLGMAAAAVGLQTIVEGLMEGTRAAAEQAQKFRELAEARKAANLAQPSMGAAARNNAQTARAARDYGIPLQRAGQIFGAAGFEGINESDTRALIAAERFTGISADSTISLLDRLRDNGVTVGAEELVNQLIAVRSATGGRPDEIIPEVEKVLADATSSGLGHTEVMAMVANLAQKRPGRKATSAAATVLDKLSKGAEVEDVAFDEFGKMRKTRRHVDFAGGTLLERLASFQSQAPEQFTESMRDADFRIAVQTLHDPSYAAALAQMQAAGGGTLLRDKAGEYLSDSTNMAEFRAAQRKAEGEALMLDRAGAGFRLEEERERRRNVLRRQGSSDFTIWMADKMHGAFDLFGPDASASVERFVADLGEGVPRDTLGSIPLPVPRTKFDEGLPDDYDPRDSLAREIARGDRPQDPFAARPGGLARELLGGDGGGPIGGVNELVNALSENTRAIRERTRPAAHTELKGLDPAPPAWSPQGRTAPQNRGARGGL